MVININELLEEPSFIDKFTYLMEDVVAEKDDVFLNIFNTLEKEGYIVEMDVDYTSIKVKVDKRKNRELLETDISEIINKHLPEKVRYYLLTKMTEDFFYIQKRH